MKNTTREVKPFRLLSSMLLAAAAFMGLLLYLKYSTIPVSADSSDAFGPACGTATLDGNVNPEEWSSASTQTFQMVRPAGGDPFTATLYVMNSGSDLYLGITINDDEFSTYAPTLQQGDGFRIDFDNDHGGSLFALGDDVLWIYAGLPQFGDGYIDIDQEESAMPDGTAGGTLDGVGAASRVGDLNHFELRHPLCSGDALDFCLHPGGTVGFRLKYFDVQAEEYSGPQFFPGSSDTSEADILIGQCSIPGIFIYLPLIIK